jgi:hypothetical protein
MVLMKLNEKQPSQNCVCDFKTVTNMQVLLTQVVECLPSKCE